MWWKVLLAVGVIFALYVIWSALQLLVGIFKDRRAKKGG